jgi:hypothetical protein
VLCYAGCLLWSVLRLGCREFLNDDRELVRLSPCHQECRLRQALPTLERRKSNLPRYLAIRSTKIKPPSDAITKTVQNGSNKGFGTAVFVCRRSCRVHRSSHMVDIDMSPLDLPFVGRGLQLGAAMMKATSSVSLSPGIIVGRAHHAGQSNTCKHLIMSSVVGT